MNYSVKTKHHDGSSETNGYSTLDSAATRYFEAVSKKWVTEAWLIEGGALTLAFWNKK